MGGIAGVACGATRALGTRPQTVSCSIENELLSKEAKRQESSSFLKKRTKKLFSVAGGTDSTYLTPLLRAKTKSFLVLFFKKELLLCFAGFSISTRVSTKRLDSKAFSLARDPEVLRAPGMHQWPR
ncbi:MAG TPA: hypothetical protein VMB71_07260 [Acetobacteraceae bacterium]|nr:hypothetical protein [Acetobacteraceae bacterium]